MRFLFCLVLAVAPRLLVGQVQLGPVLGVYAPTKDVPVGFRSARQHPAFMYGIQAQVYLDYPIALQLFIVRGESDLVQPSTPSGSPAVTQSARLTHAALTLRFGLPVAVETTPLWVALGPTVLFRGGAGYARYKDTTTLGGLLGLGTQIRLSDRLYLEAAGETLLSSLALRDSTQAYSAIFQIDFQARLGLLFHLGPLL